MTAQKGDLHRICISETVVIRDIEHLDTESTGCQQTGCSIHDIL